MELLIATQIGSFIIPFLNTLFGKAYDYCIADKLKSHSVVVGELKGITMTVRKIQAAVRQMEERQLVLDQDLMLWLRDLKDAAYGADDLLDELELATKVRKVMRVSTTTTATTVTLDQKLVENIKTIRNTLDRVAKEWGDFKLGGELDNKMISKNQLTTSFVEESRIIGRDNDKERIVELLTSFDNSLDRNAFVLPVVGTGGIGKTALIQLVYNDKKIKQYFHRRMWIYVSNVFDAQNITKEIVEYADYSGKPCKISNLDMLKMKLQERLLQNRFLIVLDDVWTDDRQQWQELLAPFVGRREGSKIVVTTRNSGVTKLEGMMRPYFLKGLSVDDSWSLFIKDYKLMELHPVSIQRLEAKNGEITDKVDGSPLVAKTLARLVSSKLVNINENISQIEIWQLQQNEGDIMPTLKRTYNHLPSHLKQCFGFCSLFKKGHRFDKSDLVSIWIAQGFIHSRYGKSMEDIGNEYFDEFVCRGILNHENDQFVMPGLMNDLAQYVSMDECSRIETDGSWEFCGSIRHLSLACKNADKMEELITSGKLNGLRTLMLFNVTETRLEKILKKLIINSQSLRVLGLQKNEISQLPESITDLKHLRYLNLSYNPIKNLPGSLDKLHNLQTLVLECKDLLNLPDSICKMSNLRHLKAKKQLISDIRNIGSMISLQELEGFQVNQDNNKIEQLTRMSELRRLSIQNLENVGNVKEASQAMLASKSHLQSLALEWSERESTLKESEQDLEILEQLQPHEDLRELSIKCYGGISSPQWLIKGTLSRVEVICLCNCPKWKSLSNLGSLCFLKTLEIRNMLGVETIDEGFYGTNEKENFPSLRELHLSDMHNLKIWSAGRSKRSFPCLTKLVMKDCPELKEMTSLPPSLEELKIISCQYLLNKPLCMALQEPSLLFSFTISNDYYDHEYLSAEVLKHLTVIPTVKIEYFIDEIWPSSSILIEYKNIPQQILRLAMKRRTHDLPSNHNNIISEWLPKLTSLSRLTICSTCDNDLTFIEQVDNLSGLKELILQKCQNLDSVRLDKLTSLKKLVIEDTPAKSFNGFASSSLTDLEINKCNHLKSLNLKSIHSLKCLRISNCPCLENLTGLPLSLESPHIEDCPKLKI